MAALTGALDGGISALRNDARKATQNNFDKTLMIDAAFRPVDVGQAHGDMWPYFAPVHV